MTGVPTRPIDIFQTGMGPYGETAVHRSTGQFQMREKGKKAAEESSSRKRRRDGDDDESDEDSIPGTPSGEEGSSEDGEEEQ